MRYTSIAALATVVAIGSASASYAQGHQQFGQRQDDSNQYGRESGGQQQSGQNSGGNRFQARSSIRQQLRQVGFQNIRILDSAFLVQASTPQGRTVLMVVDPPGNFGILGVPAGQQDQQSGQQGSQSGRMGQRSDMSHNLSGQGSEGGQGGGQNTIMTESQVRSMLQKQGLTNIQNLQRDGDTYTASADWQGDQVDVSVNARTGEIDQPSDHQ